MGCSPFKQAADPVFRVDTKTIRTCLCVLLDAEGGRPGLKPVVWGVQMESDVPVMCTDSTHDMIILQCSLPKRGVKITANVENAK